MAAAAAAALAAANDDNGSLQYLQSVYSCLVASRRDGSKVSYRPSTIPLVIKEITTTYRGDHISVGK